MRSRRRTQRQRAEAFLAKLDGLPKLHAELDAILDEAQNAPLADGSIPPGAYARLREVERALWAVMTGCFLDDPFMVPEDGGG
jgi:hypothetical protein